MAGIRKRTTPHTWPSIRTGSETKTFNSQDLLFLDEWQLNLMVSDGNDPSKWLKNLRTYLRWWELVSKIGYRSPVSERQLQKEWLQRYRENKLKKMDDEHLLNYCRRMTRQMTTYDDLKWALQMGKIIGVIHKEIEERGLEPLEVRLDPEDTTVRLEV